MSRRRYRELTADFETTTDPEDCRVWAWAIANVDPEPYVTFGTELSDFLEDLSRFDAKVWFHNLKFDAAFIMDFLMANRYEHTFEQHPEPGEFSTLISRVGEHYQVTVAWMSGHKTIFMDSHKKLPMSVENVAKTFDLPELKGDLDYEAYRPPGYQPTAQEWDYVRRDVTIMAQALHVRLEQGKRLTTGADAMQGFKQSISTQLYNKTFPILNVEMDREIRAAYRGGYAYLNPEHRAKRLGPGTVYDVNSMYPWVMKTNPLPYGLPRWFPDYPPDNGLYIVSISFTATLREGHLPMIQIRNSWLFDSSEYLAEVSEMTHMVVTNVDLELMHEHYHMNILSWNGGYAFKDTTGIFDDYIDHWMEVKENSVDGEREIAKLFLVSLYGKFATNPDIQGKYPVWDDYAQMVYLDDAPEEIRDPVYTPMGAFITSYARDKMIRTAQANYDRFIYCDTDSLHLTGTDPLEGVEVHPTRLGAWDHEYDFTDAVFLRVKRYAHEVHPEYQQKFGERVVRIAGAPSYLTTDMQLSDMVEGRQFPGKLTPVRVPGGMVLTETTFTLN